MRAEQAGEIMTGPVRETLGDERREVLADAIRDAFPAAAAAAIIGDGQLLGAFSRCLAREDEALADVVLSRIAAGMDEGSAAGCARTADPPASRARQPRAMSRTEAGAPERWKTSEVASFLGFASVRSTASALHRWRIRPVGREPGRDGENLYDPRDIRDARAGPAAARAPICPGQAPAPPAG
jgi:hypothetical protein